VATKIVWPSIAIKEPTKSVALRVARWFMESVRLCERFLLVGKMGGRILRNFAGKIREFLGTVQLTNSSNSRDAAETEGFKAKP